MRVLVLGGTAFLGRHIVEALEARGHDLTLFHRGKTGADLFPEIEHVLGDRESEIEKIGDRSFDAVIDTSAYLPHVSRASAAHLAPRAKRYLFVSTINAYASFAAPVDENAPEAELPDDVDTTVFTPEHYGALKVLCEREVIKAFGEARTVIVRPGLIVGPYDVSDRYTHWVDRIARGGDVPVPGDPSFPAQYIDARDLAEWIVRLMEDERHGIYNAVPKAASFTLGNTFDAIVAATQSPTRLIWINEAFLKAQGVSEWMDMPLWIAESDEMRYFFEVDSTRAIATGLQTRSPIDTASATFAWLPARGEREWKAGLTPGRERALLRVWRDRTSAR